jgi:type II secretory pathway component PulL
MELALVVSLAIGILFLLFDLLYGVFFVAEQRTRRKHRTTIMIALATLLVVVALIVLRAMWGGE